MQPHSPRVDGGLALRVGPGRQSVKVVVVVSAASIPMPSRSVMPGGPSASPSSAGHFSASSSSREALIANTNAAPTSNSSPPTRADKAGRESELELTEEEL